MDLKIIRTNSENKDFVSLVKQLDAYLKITDGEEHSFYNQFNNIDVLKNVVVLFEENKALGCGAIKPFDEKTMEVKRMFVEKKARGKGFAKAILKELETWAIEKGYKKCTLETGKRQIEAVQLYHKCGYKVIPNYGQYKNMDNSICFEKEL